jgi:hypothetical protein
MATSATYYLDGPDLQSATAVYTDATLLTKAADGWYSVGGFVREQVGGLLQANVLCTSCPLDCSTSLVLNTTSGYYTVPIDFGVSTGAIQVEIEIPTVPSGIKIEYDGVTYNSVYSDNFGYLSSTGIEPIYLGVNVFDCSISGTTFDNLYGYQFNGSEFNSTEIFYNATVDPASVQLQSSGLGTCRMIIPKTAASPSTATLTIISPCSESIVTVTPECPAALPSFLLTRTGPEPTNVSGLCSLSIDQPFYHVPVNGTAGNPAVGDIMFQDANGSTIALQGFYAVVGYPSSAAVIEVDANGIIINSILACIP